MRDEQSLVCAWKSFGVVYDWAAAQCLHMAAQGLQCICHMAAQGLIWHGLHMAAQGLDMAAEGLPMAAQGLQMAAKCEE